MWVQAVAPGSITNPTFGPLNNNVQIQRQLECQVVKSLLYQTAFCPDGYVVTGGGVECDDGGDELRIWPNTDNNSVLSLCSANWTRSYAVCCSVISE